MTGWIDSHLFFQAPTKGGSNKPFLNDMPVSEVFLEDCMIGMKRYPDKFFDLAVVDPPYGIGMADWDNEIPKPEYFIELQRVSLNQMIFGGNYFHLSHTESWVCWDKTFVDDIRESKLTKGGCPRENMSDFELIWTSFNHKAKMFRFTQIGNLIGIGKHIAVDYDHQSKIHPTQKHITIYRWLLTNYAKPGDKILDTHLGSQSSRIAAYDLGFDFYGWEIDKDYFEAGNKRFENFKKQLKLF